MTIKIFSAVFCIGFLLSCSEEESGRGDVMLENPGIGDLGSEEVAVNESVIKVCSYNLWSSSARKSRIEKGKDADSDGDISYADKCHYWKTGKGYVMNNIIQDDCDIYGFQECCDSIVNDLGGLDLHLSPTSTDNIIAWNDDKLEMKSYGLFWNNFDDPDTYCSSYSYTDVNGVVQTEAARSCVWAKMRVRSSGKQFLFANTHGPLNDSINVRFAELVVRRLEEINPEHLPLIITGDFNAGNAQERSGEEGMMYDCFLSVWKNARVEAEDAGLLDGNEMANPGTHVGYMDDIDHIGKELHRIDHVFAEGFAVVDYYVNRSNFEVEGVVRYPSDHLPVCASYIFED